jgi:hypothetical protein
MTGSIYTQTLRKPITGPSSVDKQKTDRNNWTLEEWKKGYEDLFRISSETYSKQLQDYFTTKSLSEKMKMLEQKNNRYKYTINELNETIQLLISENELLKAKIARYSAVIRKNKKIIQNKKSSISRKKKNSQ